MGNDCRFIEWRHRTERTEHASVFPDGCRDVLIIRPGSGPEQVILTELDFSPRDVVLSEDIEITGYRLRPGAALAQTALQAIRVQTHQAQTILAEACGEASPVDEAISALCVPGISVDTAAEELGVSVRTLQRHFRAHRQPSPQFWSLLARARRAAGQLATSAPLAEIADACGFSDQAHMSRELMRWFGRSPAQLRRTDPVIEQLLQPALGNWTGEHSSTR